LVGNHNGRQLRLNAMWPDDDVSHTIGVGARWSMHIHSWPVLESLHVKFCGSTLKFIEWSG